MIRIVIIDDEKNSREVIAAVIEKRCPQAQIVGFADSVNPGVEAIDRLQPDLVLLDIQLGSGTGFDILQQVKNRNFNIIFVTAFDEYAIKAFKFSATDYILKPINSIELARAVNKLAESKHISSEKELQALVTNYLSGEKKSKKIILKTQDSIYAVDTKDILRCEADTYYTKFYLADGQMIMVSATLKEYDEMLSEFRFFRVHQSHLINLDYFSRYNKADGGTAVLKDGTAVPVAQRKKEAFLEAIARH